jgi:hypothetical protein
MIVVQSMHKPFEIFIYNISKHVLRNETVLPNTKFINRTSERISLGYNDGVRIVYKDGTKRFISNSWYNDISL